MRDKVDDGTQSRILDTNIAKNSKRGLFIFHYYLNWKLKLLDCKCPPQGQREDARLNTPGVQEGGDPWEGREFWRPLIYISVIRYCKATEVPWTSHGLKSGIPTPQEEGQNKEPQTGKGPDLLRWHPQCTPVTWEVTWRRQEEDMGFRWLQMNSSKWWSQAAHESHAMKIHRFPIEQKDRRLNTYVNIVKIPTEDTSKDPKLPTQEYTVGHLPKPAPEKVASPTKRHPQIGNLENEVSAVHLCQQ